MEAEKRVRKRRMRLLLAVEDAFAHATRMTKEASDAINRNSAVGGVGGFSAYQNGQFLLIIDYSFLLSSYWSIFSVYFKRVFISLKIHRAN